MKLSEEIILTDILGDQLELIVTNCKLTEAIRRVIKSGIETKIQEYIITVKNYRQLDSFLEDELKEVIVEGQVYGNFSLSKIDKGIYNLTIFTK